MHVRRVAVHNIRAFREAELDLCPDGKNYAGWAVITGDNGAGKTTLLRSIALAVLGPDQARDVLPNPAGWVYGDEERGTMSAEVRPHTEFDKTQKGGAPYKSTFWAEVAITREDETWMFDQVDVYRRKKKGATNGPWPETTQGWFIAGYGPFRRFYGMSQDASKVQYGQGRGPRFATLFLEGATLGGGEEWIKNLEFARLDYEFRGREDKELEARTLRNLLDLISADFLRNGVKIDEIDSSDIWLKDVAGRRLRLNDMSEGYRAALAMLIDIFRQMVDVYGPDIVAESADGTHYIDRPGIVLIDEVDAHLHPEWQRDIGFWLQRHFPEVQFVVTTHSPLVCAAATNGRIYHVPQPGQGSPFQLTDDDYRTVLAGKPDEILLTPAFGMRDLRSPVAANARREHALLMSKALTLGELSPPERERLEQLAFFVELD